MRSWIPRQSRLVLAALLLALTAWAPTVSARPEPAAWEALRSVEQSSWEPFTPASGDLLAWTEQGLFRSDDAGVTWDTVSRPAQTNIVAVSPVDHQVLYAAGVSGVYRSSDGGQSWERVSDLANGWIRIAVSPADPNVLYGTATGIPEGPSGSILRIELRVSRDAGATWEVVWHFQERFSGASYPCGYALRFQPHVFDSTRLLTIQGCTVRGDPASMMSTDEGRTSSPFPNLGYPSWAANAAVGGRGVNPGRWYVSLFRPNILYTRIRHSKVMRTDDDGATWTTIYEDDSGEPYKSPKPVDFVSLLTYDPRRPDDLFAVFEHYEPSRDRFEELKPRGFTVKMSRDAGATWCEVGARDLPKVSSLAVDVDGRFLYAATAEGVYRLALNQ
jgi:hypothetical protein